MRVGAKTFVGEQVRGGRDHTDFFTCPTCRQIVDMRDLAAVFHHEIDGHQAQAIQEASRLIQIERQLLSALADRRRSEP